MEKEDLQILMLEDNELDAELNIQQLSYLEEYNCIINLIQTKEDYIKEIESSTPPQLILCDYNLPQYNGMEALKDLNTRGILIPFVFVTGTMQEEVAVDAIKAGAWDYVVKDRLFRLPLAVRGALGLKKEREAARKAKEKIFRLIQSIDKTSAQIIIADENHRIEYANRKVCEITGMSLKELTGSDARLSVIYEDHPEYESKINACFEKGEIFRGELLARNKNNERRWELVSITPIKNRHGEITNFVAVKEDITAQKKLEKDLIKARDEAEESNRLKTAFLHNVSHEIRTPLNVIGGYSNLLKEREFTEAERQDFISVINSSSAQLVSIINDIFAISTLEANQEQINREKFNVNSVIDELYDIFKQKAAEKDIAFSARKSLPDGNAVIHSDRIKITQILSNLINNALKFTSEGSIKFGYLVNADSMEFFVNDTGIGIDPAFQDIIFDRFRQEDSSINRLFGGSGLGLSIAKGYAELLDGRLWVESEKGKGSSFKLSIPHNISSEEDASLTSTA